MEIRIAAGGDVASLLAIYAQYIDTSVTFEYELPTAAEFSRRLDETLRDYPYLVGCDGTGRPCGYAYAHRLREREAYQWSAELSIYLSADSTSRGLGKKLYAVLIGLLELQGIRTVYGCVTAPNPRSEKLHDSLGFRPLGTFRRAGFKLGVWHDVTWFEKAIAAYDRPPLPVTPFSRLAPERVREVLDRFRP